MNALVNVRAHGLGNLNVTFKQRQEALQEITSTYRAKATAIAKSAATTKQNGASAPEPAAQAPDNQLGRDAFLQLLVVQLQNQDPLEPVDNSEMLAQLAQFSALEQAEGLNRNFEFLSGNVDQLNFISAQGLLGKYIEGVNEEGEVTTGFVDSVFLDGSIVVLNVDGQVVNMSSVLSIRDQPPESGGADDGE